MAITLRQESQTGATTKLQEKIELMPTSNEEPLKEKMTELKN